MSGNSFGRLFKITTWGESHGKAVGVVVDGCPSNVPLTEEDIQLELDRRKPGTSKIVTPRKESDKVEILSGIFEGKTTGTPISMIVWNRDADSTKYEPIKNLFRPGHGDYGYWKKYGIRDYRGGGRASARETIGRVAAGAIAKKLLKNKGIETFAFTSRVGDICGEEIDVGFIEENILRAADSFVYKNMEDLIVNTRKEGNSIGCEVTVISQGVFAGLGEPVFDKLDADISKALMSIGAVKAVEIGIGKNVIQMKGSTNNDPFYVKEHTIKTKTNNAGGILAGISNGSDIVVRLSVKPTPSIHIVQQTVNESFVEEKIVIEGRHDPIICPRLIPVAEAMLNIVILDNYLIQRATKDFWDN